MSLRSWAQRALPEVVITSPFEFFLSAAMIIVGLSLVLLGAEPHSLEIFMPQWFVYGWGAAVTIGGFATCYGLIKRSPITEAFGLRLLAMATFAYSACVFVVLHAGGVATGLLMFALACSFYFRIYTIVSAEKIVQSHTMQRLEDDA